jgi:hypothetical protein
MATLLQYATPMLALAMYATVELRHAAVSFLLHGQVCQLQLQSLPQFHRHLLQLLARCLFPRQSPSRHRLLRRPSTTAMKQPKLPHVLLERLRCTGPRRPPRHILKHPRALDTVSTRMIHTLYLDTMATLPWWMVTTTWRSFLDLPIRYNGKNSGSRQAKIVLS